MATQTTPGSEIEKKKMREKMSASIQNALVNPDAYSRLNPGATQASPSSMREKMNASIQNALVNPMASFDSRMLPSFATGLDSSLLESVSNDWKSTWGDKYYYDAFDPADIQRQLAGAMPKYLQDKYDPNDEVDRWLLQNNLPYKSLFNDSYSEAYLKNRAQQAERQELLGGMADTFSKYDTGMSALQRDFNQRVQAATTAKADAAAQQKGRKKSQNISTDLSEGEQADILNELLTSGKYDNLAPFYAEGKTSGNDVLDYMAGVSGPDYSLYDAAFAAIRRGQTPPDAFFANFKQSDYEKWLKKQLGFDEYSLLDSLMAAPAAAATVPTGKADAASAPANVPDERDAAQIMMGVGAPSPSAANTTVSDGNLDEQIREAKAAQQKARRSRDYRRASEYQLLIEDLEGKKHQTEAQASDPKAEEREARREERQERRAERQAIQALPRDERPAAREALAEEKAQQAFEAEAAAQGLTPEQYAAYQKAQHDALVQYVYATGNDALQQDYNAKQAEIDVIEQQIKKTKTAQHMALQNGDHDEATRHKQAGKDLESQRAAARAELQQASLLLDVSDSLVAQEKLNSILKSRSNPDFEEKSQVSKDVAETLTGDIRAFYKSINGLGDGSTAAKLLMGSDRRLYAPELYTADLYMTDEERAAFNYIAATQGQEGAQEFYDILIPALYARDREALTEAAASMTETTWGKIGSSALTVLGQLEQAREGGAAIIRGGLGAITKEETLLRNDPRLGMTAVSDGVRGNIAQDIAEKHGQAGAFVYQTGMSILDTLARLPLGQAGLAIAGLSAASSTMDSAVQSGATSDQALALGAVAGAVEIVTEKMGLDSLFRIVDMPQATFKAVLVNMLKQAGVEATEEGIAEIVNIAADVIYNADEGEWAQSVSNYMAQGLSYEEAQKMTIRDKTLQVGGASAGGFASGLLFGAGGQVTGAYKVGQNSGGNVFNSAVVGQRALNAYHQAQQQRRMIGADIQVRIAQDIRSLGLNAQTAEAITAVSDMYAQQPANWVTPAGAKLYTEFAKIVSDNAARTHTWAAQREAQAVKAQERLSTLYSNMQRAYDATAAALESGDLNAHTKALQTVNKAMQEYKSAHAMAQADTTAREAVHAEKMSSAQGKVLSAAEALEAQMPTEIEYQQRVAADIEAQMPLAAAQTVPNMLDTTQSSDGSFAGTAAPAGAQAVVGNSQVGQAAGPAWLQGYPSTRIQYGDQNAGQHFAAMQQTIAEYKGAVDPDVLELAERSKEDKNAPFLWRRIGDLTSRAARDIEHTTGENLEGGHHRISSTTLNHILKRHGENGQHDHSLADMRDIARIPWVLENYDYMERTLDQNGAPAFSEGIRGSDGKPAPLVSFIKRVDGMVYVIEAVAENRRRICWVESAFIKKGAPRVPHAKGLGATSKTVAAEALENIIPSGAAENNPENVNFSEQMRGGSAQTDVIKYMAGVPGGELTGRAADTMSTLAVDPTMATMAGGQQDVRDSNRFQQPSERDGSGQARAARTVQETNGHSVREPGASGQSARAVPERSDSVAENAGIRKGRQVAGGDHSGVFQGSAQSRESARIKLAQNWPQDATTALSMAVADKNASIAAKQDGTPPLAPDDLRPAGKINPRSQKLLERLLRFAGASAYIYDSKSGRTDVPGGFVYEGDIFARNLPGGSMVFHAGHEVAENTKGIRDIGLELLRTRLGDESFENWLKNVRSEPNVRGEKRAKLKKEFVCDAFGAVMYEVVSGERMYDKLGISKADAQEFENAFLGSLALYAYEESIDKGDTLEQMTLGKKGVSFSDTKFSNIPHVKVEAGQDVFDNAPKSTYPKIALELIRERYVGHVIGGETLSAFVNSGTAREYAYPRARMSKVLTEAKMRASTELSSILDTSEFLYHADDDGRHPEAVGGWEYFRTRFSIGEHLFQGVVNIMNTSKGRLLYDVTKIKDITADTYGSGATRTRTVFDSDISINNISKTGENINQKTKNSQSDDIDFSSTAIGEVQTRSIVRNVLERYDVADYRETARQLAPEIFSIVSSMLDGTVGYESVEQLHGIARGLLETASVETAGEGYAAGELESLKSYLRGEDGKAGFRLTEKQRQEVVFQYGSYNDYSKALRGVTGISAEQQYTLDRIWDELCELFPQHFDADTTEGDMPLVLYDVIESLKNPARHNPYADDIDGAATELANELVERVQTVLTPGNREAFSDEYGNMFSYQVPAVKQHADGTYYADIAIGGETQRFEAASAQKVRAQVQEAKQNNILNHPSAQVKAVRTAMDAYEEGLTPAAYWKKNRKNWTGENQLALAHLRGIHQRNGNAVGGMLGQAELETLTRDSAKWKDPRAAGYTFSAPVRIFENKGAWRPGDTFENAMRNIDEGNRLSDTYVLYAMRQNADKELWIDGERQKVVEAFTKGGIRESTLVQMLGEGVITDAEAAGAVYDKDHMIVRVADGLMVFDKSGQLKAMSDSQDTWLFEKKYRNELRQQYAEIHEQLEARKKENYNRSKLDQLRDKLGAVKPVKIPGQLVGLQFGDTFEVQLPGGKTLAKIVGGKHADMKIVRDTTEALRDFYDRAFAYQSQTLIENGYAPVEFREHYFPHQARIEAGLSGFIDSIMGQDLPAEISGMTEGFKPGRPWTNHLLQRMGDHTEFDAMRGFNRYVQAAGDLIYNTPVIQRIRQLEQHLREQAAEAGLEGNKNTANANSRFVAWLRDYGNRFANKKSDLDRGWEDMFGREVYTLTDKLAGAYSAAAIGGNVSSAMSNLISYLSALPTLDAKYAFTGSMRAALQSIEAAKGALGQDNNYDGFADKIPFLMVRRGAYEKIATQSIEKAKAAGGKALYALFSATDYLTTEAVARSKYAEMLGKGLSEAEAVKRTDAYCVKLFAERSAQMAPKFFSSRLMKVFGQFQLEVLNQMSHGRDIKRYRLENMLDNLLLENNGKIDDIDFTAIETNLHKSGAWRDWARKLMYMVLLSIWGGVTRAVMGRDQTWNPAGMAIDAARDHKEGGLKQAAKGLATGAIEQAPFASFLVGGGRVPVMGGFDNAVRFVQDVFDKEMTGGQKALSGLKAFTAFIPGGGQARKAITGIRANQQGGYYTQDGRLRYPITEEQFWQTAIFGPSAAAPGGYDWSSAPLTPAKTEAYETLVDEGLDPMDVWYFMAGYNPSTNATEALSILTADADRDGQPDFDAQTMEMIAAVMGLDYNPRRDGSLERWAKKESDRYLSEKKRKSELSESERKNMGDIEEFWQILVGMKAG